MGDNGTAGLMNRLDPRPSSREPTPLREPNVGASRQWQSPTFLVLAILMFFPVRGSIMNRVAQRDDTINRTLQVYAHEVIAFLSRMGDLNPRVVRVEDGGISVSIAVTLHDDFLDRLTDCERDVLTVISDAEGFMTKPKVLADLDRRNMSYSDSTVKRAMARLVTLGLLRSTRGRAGGYIPDKERGFARAGLVNGESDFLPCIYAGEINGVREAEFVRMESGRAYPLT
jgi:Fe2+ or Zn2+ uptake regulation protein